MSTVTTSTSSPTPPAFQPEAFGKYYLIDKVAVGGMAEIFKAKSFGHGGFENLVVIKRILAHMSDNENFIQMFLDEAKVTALLQHSNIVRIWDFGRIRENYFLAMECVEGKDVKLLLRKLAERRKILPREFAVYIAMEAAKGLDYAHKKANIQGHALGIVHRDISPSNILVGYHGDVKVADFGIVQASNVTETTGQGTLKGKFEYMSPEQASGAELDRRSDIFSLGIILHEMLTGRRLFKTDNEIKTLDKIKGVDIDPPSATNPQVPARLDEIVMRALSKDRSDRYQDASEMKADLLEFLYPASPDLTQQSLSHFMAELFNEEISAERGRMEANTRGALALYENANNVDIEPEWEEGQNTGTQANQVVTPPQKPSRVPLVLALVALGFAAAALIAGGVYMTTLEQPVPVVEVTTGTLDIKVTPVAGKIYFDDKLIGNAASATVPNVAPGVAHKIRVEADGFEIFKDDATLGKGERLRMTAALQKKAEVPKAPVPSQGGQGGRNDAPRPNGAVTPGAGGVAPVEPPKPAVEAAPGKLNLNVSGGWADVFVDGRKIGQTPIFGHSLAAGTHSVRAKNETTGLDATKQVTIKSGETATVSFSAQ